MANLTSKAEADLFLGRSSSSRILCLFVLMRRSFLVFNCGVLSRGFQSTSPHSSNVIR